VKWLLDRVDSQLYTSTPLYELFELFRVAFYACRINSHVVLGRNELPLRELLAGGMCTIDKTITVQIQPVQIITAAEEYGPKTESTIREKDNTAQNKYNWIEGNGKYSYVVKNANSGEGIDLFFSLHDPSRNRTVKINEQAKFIATATMSKASVKAIIKRMHAVNDMVSNETQTVIAVVCNTLPRAGKFTEGDLPPNCVLVLRDHHHAYHGMYHIHPASSAAVDITTCSDAMLTTLHLRMPGKSLKQTLAIMKKWRKENGNADSEAGDKFLLDNQITQG
jgi:hypothetical protein